MRLSCPTARSRRLLGLGGRWFASTVVAFILERLARHLERGLVQEKVLLLPLRRPARTRRWLLLFTFFWLPRGSPARGAAGSSAPVAQSAWPPASVRRRRRPAPPPSASTAACSGSYDASPVARRLRLALGERARSQSARFALPPPPLSLPAARVSAFRLLSPSRLREVQSVRLRAPRAAARACLLRCAMVIFPSRRPAGLFVPPIAVTSSSESSSYSSSCAVNSSSAISASLARCCSRARAILVELRELLFGQAPSSAA